MSGIRGRFNFTHGELCKIISEFPRARFLIYGDLILDEFIWGDVTRISPEAPVPVVEVTSQTYVLGGAANVANNIRSLGGAVTVCGVVGNDGMGRLFTEKLEDKGIDSKGVVVDGCVPTILKTRIIAHSQQIVRIDREKRGAILEKAISQMIRNVKREISHCDAVVISDYGKGAVTKYTLKEIISMARLRFKKVFVDPKPEHFSGYKKVTVLTPNQHEAEEAIGVEIRDERHLRWVGKQILSTLGTDAVLITRGEKGMTLFEKGGRITNIPTFARQVFDVTGAGDTVIATFALSMVAGADILQSAYISNCAAGIVVGKVGTATLTRQELKDELLHIYERRV